MMILYCADSDSICEIYHNFTTEIKYNFKCWILDFFIIIIAFIYKVNLF